VITAPQPVGAPGRPAERPCLAARDRRVSPCGTRRCPESRRPSRAVNTTPCRAIVVPELLTGNDPTVTSAGTVRAYPRRLKVPRHFGCRTASPRSLAPTIAIRRPRYAATLRHTLSSITLCAKERTKYRRNNGHPLYTRAVIQFETIVAAIVNWKDDRPNTVN